jgi:UDP-N-acetylglucosamine/UDP-N-acetylgalactosamine diphosphorylase
LGEGLDILSIPTHTLPPAKEQLAQHLQRFGQDHLLRFWDELDEAGQLCLAEQIESIDFELVAELYRQAEAVHDWAALARRAEPPPAFRLDDGVGERRFTAAEATARGREAFAAGQVGVLLVAGGQGSRLGFEHPKGQYPIGPVSGASLLKIHFEKALATARRYGAQVPVYMMTSPATHDEQLAFLDQHDRFGLTEDDLVVFCQGTMPAVDAATGRLLLADKGQLFRSPDGHGGTVAALASSGALQHMLDRGIHQLFYLQVDNPIVPICDPALVGYHLLAESELTSLAVAKQGPHDRVGNFVSVDGRVQVIEYSDFPDDVAERRAADGSLVFWAGSIAVHVFDVDFLRRALELKDALPFHVARKAVPYVDDAGSSVVPAGPNALKFERFIFDLLPHAARAIVVEGAEADVFAPLKNGPGADRDTAEYVQRFMIDQHRRWLTAAGVRVADGVPVEISPLWALDAQAVAERTDLPQTIDRPTYLR